MGAFFVGKRRQKKRETIEIKPFSEKINACILGMSDVY